MHAKHSTFEQYCYYLLIFKWRLYTIYGNRVLCVGFLLVEYIWCISNIQKLTYLPFILFCKGIAQTSCQLDPELYFSNEIQLKFLERNNGEDSI
jgi:hypothetical protein